MFLLACMLPAAASKLPSRCVIGKEAASHVPPRFGAGLFSYQPYHRLFLRNFTSFLVGCVEGHSGCFVVLSCIFHSPGKQRQDFESHVCALNFLRWISSWRSDR